MQIIFKILNNFHSNKKRGGLAILCIIIGIFVWTNIPQEKVFAAFSDTSNHTYQASILELQARGIVQGYPDGTFKPDKTITRAEILKIVLGAYGDLEKINFKPNCFPDVTDQRYAPFVCYAKHQGIIQGYPDGSFKPDQTVTIAEGLKIAFETFHIHTDTAINQDRYQQYINFAHRNNMLSKYAIYPDNAMTRGHMSYIVHQLILDKEELKPFTNQRDNRSAGCFTKSEPDTPLTASRVNGIERNYITAIGRKYNHDNPTKLIIAFHGRTNPNTQVRGYYDIEQVRDHDGIVIYPAGLPAGRGFSRSDGGDPSSNLRDFALFDQLVQELSQQYCINMDKIYVRGHSLGGRFTNTLACSRGDIIRAIGSVGGSTTPNKCTGPVAAIIMHNPKDNLASFAGGEHSRDILLQQNACDPSQTKPVGPEQGNCVEYTDCLEGAPVVWCPHTQDQARRNDSYYPHTRPDFASKEIRDFFEKIN